MSVADNLTDEAMTRKTDQIVAIYVSLKVWLGILHRHRHSVLRVSTQSLYWEHIYANMWSVDVLSISAATVNQRDIQVGSES